MATNNARSWAPLVPLVTAAIYGASPIDLIPDILLLVGWVDDALMGVVMAFMALWLFVRSRKRQNVAGTVPPMLPIRR